MSRAGTGSVSRAGTGGVSKEEQEKKLMAAAVPLVVSFTTSPTRLEDCGRMVRHLRARQTLRDFELRLLMPRFFGRTREPFGGAMPSWWERERNLPGPRLVFAVVDDAGPATKLLGNLQAEEQGQLPPAALYVTVDDDYAYEPHTVEHLVRQAARHPGCALGFSGVRFLRSLDTSGRIVSRGASAFGSSQPGAPPRAVDMLEGFGGVLYPRDALLALAPLHRALLAGALPSFASRCDDYLISNALAALGFPRLAVSHPEVAPWRPGVAFTYGMGSDALHAIDGADPATRYRPLMEWCAEDQQQQQQQQGMSETADPSLPPMLRDAFWRDPLERADVVGDIPGEWEAARANSTRPDSTVGWAILVAVVFVALLLARKVRRLSWKLAVLALLMVAAAVVSGSLFRTRRGLSKRSRSSSPPNAHPSGTLEPEPHASAQSLPPVPLELADVRLGSEVWRWRRRSMTGAGKKKRRSATAGRFLKLANGGWAWATEDGLARIVEQETKGQVTDTDNPTRAGKSSEGKAIAIAVLSDSTLRPEHLARTLASRRPPVGLELPPHVVLSFSTSPTRLQLCRPMIESLLADGAAPPGSEVRALVPREFARTGERFEGWPAWWEEVAALAREKRGVTLRGVTLDWDAGPATKLLGNLAADNEGGESSSIIITLDDDIAYDAPTIHTLLARAAAYPRCAVCSRGFLVGPDPLDFRMLAQSDSGAAADVMEGFAGIAYRRWMLDALEPLVRPLVAAMGSDRVSDSPSATLTPPRHAAVSDDLVLSNALAALGVTRLCMRDPFVSSVTVTPLAYGLGRDALFRGSGSRDAAGSNPTGRYRKTAAWMGGASASGLFRWALG